MNKFRIVIAVISLICGAASPASACNTCHSKNPKMVKMHQELGMKDCFTCHGQGIKEKDSPEQKEQMKTDPRCSRCHK